MMIKEVASEQIRAKATNLSSVKSSTEESSSEEGPGFDLSPSSELEVKFRGGAGNKQFFGTESRSKGLGTLEGGIGQGLGGIKDATRTCVAQRTWHPVHYSAFRIPLAFGAFRMTRIEGRGGVTLSAYS